MTVGVGSDELDEMEQEGGRKMATTALSDADREPMCKKLMELIEHCQKCLKDMQYNGHAAALG